MVISERNLAARVGPANGIQAAIPGRAPPSAVFAESCRGRGVSSGRYVGRMYLLVTSRPIWSCICIGLRACWKWVTVLVFQIHTTIFTDKHRTLFTSLGTKMKIGPPRRQMASQLHPSDISYFAVARNTINR